MAAGGSAALHPETSQRTVVFITEDRTGVALIATLAETAEGNNGAVQRRTVNFDLEEDETESMENRAIFLSFRMRLYNKKGELYANHSGEAFDVLRKALWRFVELSENQAGLTVFKTVMMELKRRTQWAPLRMSALVHVAEMGKLTMQFTLSDGSGVSKNFRLEFGVMEVGIKVYKIDGVSKEYDDDDGDDGAGYVSAYSGGYIADIHRGAALGMGHDLALQESINKEMIRWWPRTDVNRVTAASRGGCLGAWSVHRYMECTLRLFAGKLQHHGAGAGGTEGESPFPLVLEEDGIAEGLEVARGEQAMEGDQNMAQVSTVGVERDPGLPLVEARPVQPSAGGASAEQGLSMLQVYNEVAKMVRGRVLQQQLDLHNNQLGMFTLHVCEVQVHMQSKLPGVGQDKWKDRKDFVAKLQQSLSITGTTASVQMREREVAGKKTAFTLVKMKVTAAPSQQAIENLQKHQLQLLNRGGGETIDWRGKKVRVYVWLGTQAPGDTAIFEIQSAKTFAELGKEMKNRGICNWIYRGNFQVDPLKAVRSNRRVTGPMSVMVLKAEEYEKMARWEKEDESVKIKLASSRKTYEVRDQEGSYQWVCPQDEVEIERDTYFIKVTPLQSGMRAVSMRERQKKMRTYDEGQGQLDNISLGQDARRKYYARYVGKGPDIVSIVEFYADMAGVNGYPINPRVELISVSRWDSQFKLDSDICSKCCEVGHNDSHCMQMMVCQECFTLGDRQKLGCSGTNCRWPKRNTKEERRRYEILDSNSLRRTALKYISAKSGLRKSGEDTGSPVVRMPSNVTVTAQIGKEDKRRVIAGPTTGETYEEVERIFAASDQAEVARDVSKEYYRQVTKGTAGTQLFNETTSALKAKVRRGELSPTEAGKVQLGAKQILTDVIAGGNVSNDTWKATLDQMCGMTNFHRLQGTPSRIVDAQTGLTPVVGGITLDSRIVQEEEKAVARYRGSRAKRRLAQEEGGREGRGSAADDSESSTSSTSTSSSDTSTSDSETDSSESDAGAEGGAGRKSKRKKRKGRRKKKERRKRRKKKRRRKQRREQKRERKRKRRLRDGEDRSTDNSKGRVSSGTTRTRADPKGVGHGT